LHIVPARTALELTRGLRLIAIVFPAGIPLLVNHSVAFATRSSSVDRRAGAASPGGIEQMATLEMEAGIRCKKRPPDLEEHRRERVRRACASIADLDGVFAEARIRRALQVARDYVEGAHSVEELITALDEVRPLARESSATAEVWTLAEADRAAAAGATRQAALAVALALSQALDPAGCLRQPDTVRLDRRWPTTTVVALAQLIERNGQFDLLPILADALEDAGCDDTATLDHCRALSPHGPECWVVAAILRVAHATEDHPSGRSSS
jgi:hypothetical protein